MAVSNVYKPGWRSRRRSRLSLVERAVPRLGRVTGPENVPTSKTLPTPMTPSAAGNEQQHETGGQVDATSSERREQRPQEVHDELTKRLARPSPLSSEDQERGPEDVDRIDPHLADDAKPETSTSPDTGTAPGTEQDAAEDIASPLSLVSPTLPTPRLVADAENDLPRMKEPSSPPKALEAAWDIDDMSAAVKAKVNHADVQLDLDSLVASGVVDPRDRNRPLPANIDEVARALVRQALSDQSGWRDRIILVSSARESRAKSMAAINFAFALTTIDRHAVVLLDANMDGSGVGSYLGVAGHPGLTTALCDSAVEIEDIALETNVDRLTFVASGGFEEDILDRFASRRMLEILRFLTRNPNTLLVLDAPPILSSQEATVLSVIAGQVALVVEAGVTNETSINLALKRIGDRHNVSLVLSENSGVVHEEPTLPETPASRRLALPTPKRSKGRRRLTRAVAGFIVGIGLGSGVLLGIGQPPSNQGKKETLKEKLLQLGSSAFDTKPIALKIGGIAR